MIDKSWFTEADRRTMINTLLGKIQDEVTHLAQSPTSDNIIYDTAVSRANIAWYTALLNIADPDRFQQNTLTKRVKVRLTLKQYQQWNNDLINRLMKTPPHRDPVLATFTHQIINNGVQYGII